MISLADLPFIEVLMNIIHATDVTTGRMKIFSTICFCGMLITAYIAYEYINYVENKRPITMTIYCVAIITLGMLSVTTKYNQYDQLNIDEVLAKAEQNHPEVYTQAKADHVRALYSNCYVTNEGSCTINSFVKKYMIENWNTKTN